eukprot:5444635-Pyramimonas_sp.AAC.1
MRDPNSIRKAKLKLLNAPWNPNLKNNLRTISFRELTNIRSERNNSPRIRGSAVLARVAEG